MMKYLIPGLVLSVALVGCNAKDANKTEEKIATETTASSTVVEGTHASEVTTEHKDADNHGHEQDNHGHEAGSVEIVKFSGPDNSTFELKSSDKFETAELTDNSGKTYQLKAAVAASGLKMANDDGVSIHFKNGDGTVELVKDKPIDVKEVK
ncbi:hypothetical protein EC844_11515 [Acinetobacter calcoaceticus]|uniref:Lipoprotein n=1 Tax=Acinetobacter calcoaceticus TaxID=471 RepID=A0A4V2R0L9_ACICA|nr:hypothetical protein EC844_11515 [Acinetobacter calcoaceticus]